MKQYWWSRYGNFPPGEGILPHMGRVIAFYREKRGYTTAADFAIAAGVTKRTVDEWESLIMISPERRVFLAKLLKIPPALLGLDWRLVVYQDNTGRVQRHTLPHMAELIEEDAYYAYEDILVMGHEYIHNGGPIDIALRVERRLQKLIKITQHARATDAQAWQTLLCRYYQLSTRIKQQCLLDQKTASEHAKEAIDLAIQLEDTELIASAFVNSACTSTQQGNLVEARKDIASAMECVDKVRNSPLKGNIYLEAANINTPFAGNDESLQAKCKKWQDKAATMLHKGSIEPDETFFRFNLSAVHHEKAKSLLHWQKTKDDRKLVRSKLTTAIDTLSPDLNVWRSYYYMTEAQLYLADRDIEASAKAGKAALKYAKAMHSRMEEENVLKLYSQLSEADTHNPYVANLGVELGIFD